MCIVYGLNFLDSMIALFVRGGEEIIVYKIARNDVIVCEYYGP